MGFLNFITDTSQDNRLDDQSSIIEKLIERVAELELKLSIIQSLETRLVQLEKNYKEFKE